MSDSLDFEQLKSVWQQLDRRLARIEAQLDSEQDRQPHGQHHDRVLASTRALRPLLLGQLVQALVASLLLLTAAVFWSSHMDRPHLMLSGILVHAYSIWMLASAGYELSLLGSIRKTRYTAPVLELQTRLATLRRWRERNGLIFAYTGCFIWIPAMLMLFAYLGADVWAQQPAVVGWFLVSALLCAALVFFGLRWAHDPARPRLAAAMRAGAAGQSLQRAELALQDIQRFEQEGD